MASQTRAPTSDVSFTGTWAGGGGAGSRYQALDDHPDSGGTDVATHGTTAGEGRMGFSAFTIPAGVTNIVVITREYVRRTAGGSVAGGGRLRVNGVSYDNATASFSTSFVLKEHTWATNPNTGAAWTVADVNGSGAAPLQNAGVYMTDANPTVEFASWQIEVTYDPQASSGTMSVSAVAAGGVQASGTKGASSSIGVTGGGAFETTYTADTGGGGAAEGTLGVTGGGAVATSGAKGGVVQGLVDGGGDSSLLGTKGALGAIDASSGGAATTSGTKGASSSVGVSAGGEFTATPSAPAGTGTLTVSGGGASSTSGAKGGVAQGLVDGGGDSSLLGTKGALGAIDASSGGSSSSAGTKAASATVTSSGGGEFTTEGEAAVPGTTTILVTGGGAFTVAATTARSTTMLVTGGPGHMTTSGTAFEPQPVIPNYVTARPRELTLVGSRYSIT